MAETADSNAAGVDALNPGIGRDMREAGVDPRDTPEGPANGPMNMLAAKQDPVSVGKPDTMSKVRPNNQSGETRNGASDEKSKAKPEAGMDAEPVEAADTTLEANLGAQLNRNLDHNSQEGNAMQVEGKEADSMNIEGETAGEEKQDSAEKKEANGKVGDESDEDPFADLDDVASMDIYDLSNYTFGKKNQESKSRVMQLLSKTQMADALGKNYDERGMRRSVGGVILVHSHNFPHVLLLQRSDGKGEYALPGGRLRPGESDEEGLRRKLSAKLKPAGQATGDEDQELDIGERSTISYRFIHTKAFHFDTRIHASHPLDTRLLTPIFVSCVRFHFVCASLQLVFDRFSQEVLSVHPSSCDESQGRVSCLYRFASQQVHVFGTQELAACGCSALRTV